MVSGLAGKAYHERLVKLDLESFADRREAMDNGHAPKPHGSIFYIIPPPPIPGENDQSGLGGSKELEKTKVKN